MNSTKSFIHFITISQGKACAKKHAQKVHVGIITVITILVSDKNNNQKRFKEQNKRGRSTDKLRKDMYYLF